LLAEVFYPLDFHRFVLMLQPTEMLCAPMGAWLGLTKVSTNEEAQQV
jgi:hypothetical protein